MAGGGAPLQIPLGLDPTTLRVVFERVDGLLLAGGGDVDPAFYGGPASDKCRGIDRERDALEMDLVRWSIEAGKPLLTICRGIQVMNVALGGSLYQDLLSDMPGALRHDYFTSDGFARDHRAHPLTLVRDSGLIHLLGAERLVVNSLHHQGIKDLAPDLTPVGHAPDGLLEAVEVKGHPFAVGVQWHPEALVADDPMMRRLFEALVKAARNGRDRHL